MANHIRNKHADKLKPKTVTQPSATTWLAKPKQITEARKMAILNKLLNMIILDLLPFDHVEGKGIRELIEFFEPGFQMPCAKTITRLHETRFAEHQAELQAYISRIPPGFGSLTRDGWTGVNCKNYDCHTYHSFDPTDPTFTPVSLAVVLASATTRMPRACTARRILCRTSRMTRG